MIKIILALLLFAQTVPAQKKGMMWTPPPLTLGELTEMIIGKPMEFTDTEKLYACDFTGLPLFTVYPEINTTEIPPQRTILFP